MMVLFVLTVVMGVVATYYPLLKQNERMRAVVYQLDTQIQQEELQQRQLRASIEAMTKDRATIERLAREKLGYAKPGETVIRFEEPAASVPATR
jgi:cell division protein FtsB